MEKGIENLPKEYEIHGSTVVTKTEKYVLGTIANGEVTVCPDSRSDAVFSCQVTFLKRAYERGIPIVLEGAAETIKKRAEDVIHKDSLLRDFVLTSQIVGQGERPDLGRINLELLTS